MLKQVFGRDKELQEEVMSLSNMFNNKLDDLVDSSNKEDVISHHQNKNATSPQLPAISRNKFTTNHSESEKQIEDAKRDMSNVSFLN